MNASKYYLLNLYLPNAIKRLMISLNSIFIVKFLLCTLLLYIVVLSFKIHLGFQVKSMRTSFKVFKGIKFPKISGNPGFADAFSKLRILITSWCWLRSFFEFQIQTRTFWDLLTQAWQYLPREREKSMSTLNGLFTRN